MGEAFLIGTELLLVAAWLWAADEDEEVQVEEITPARRRCPPPPMAAEVPA